MKVRELIEYLQQNDPNLEVVIPGNPMDGGYNKVDQIKHKDMVKNDGECFGSWCDFYEAHPSKPDKASESMLVLES